MWNRSRHIAFARATGSERKHSFLRLGGKAQLNEESDEETRHLLESKCGKKPVNLLNQHPRELPLRYDEVAGASGADASCQGPRAGDGIPVPDRVSALPLGDPERLYTGGDMSRAQCGNGVAV